MSFDAKAFTKARFEQRTALVPVPELASFFKEDETPEFEVRGLDGAEFSRCSDAAKKRQNIELLIDSGVLTKDHIEELRQLLGDTKDKPADIIRRLEALVIVFPEISLPVWVKVCDVYPITFFNLSNKIFELTGQGKAVEKPLPCGEIPASDPS